MTWQTFWLFVTVTFLVSATPGPNMLLVMSSSARFGFRAARATMVQAPLLLLWPCAALSLTILVMNALCDALRDWVGGQS